MTHLYICDMKYKVILLLLIGQCCASICQAHPYYVSTAEIYIHPESQTFDISCSMFTEDLESALRKLYSHKGDIKKNIGAEELLSIIDQYIQERLEIKVGGEKQIYKLIGCETQEESTWCFLEGELTKLVPSVIVTNSLLFDFLEDQTNMVHVHWGEERKSAKLNNPNKTVEFVF